MNQTRPIDRRRKTAARREGAVLLIVLLMLLMATGTALFAMQATFYEQGASTSYAEATWTRSLAEGAAMAALVVVEEGGVPRATLAQGLAANWRDQGSGRAAFSIKYGVPTPLAGFAAPVANSDTANSVDNAGDDLAFAATMPEGLTGFCGPNRNAANPYGAFLPNARASRCQAIYETWGGVGTGTSTTAVGASTGPRPRTRTVITGIGETFILNASRDPADPSPDLVDADGQRGLHETVGMTRGYFDR